MTFDQRGAPGATYLGDGRGHFLVWAPFARKVEVRLLGDRERRLQLTPAERGYHEATVEGVYPGTRYLFRLNDDESERPDPASRYQPVDVHGPSQLTDPTFPWTDGGWCGPLLEDYIFYELHVGTFTPEGTFDAAISRLDSLRELGITALELMPIAQFPGNRNWGYDGAYPYAVQNSYGGPDGLKRLVDACHARGLALVLDVVYNHLGPEGNYLSLFGPYFTDRYRTPWGMALNFDGPQSDEVRRFFLDNALRWIQEFHVDALRLDAVHAMMDHSAYPFLQQLADEVHQLGRSLNHRTYLIAESDLNDVRLILPDGLGGYGLDGQWSDDFHHALHSLLTGERTGYYQSFGRLDDLARAYQEGYLYSGQYSPFRMRRHGNSPRLAHGKQFVVCSQNHDQVGNRMLGERLSSLVSFDSLKLAAGLVLFSPYLPLLFMGEEYGETAPFQYYISHLDSDLVEAVRRGRAAEFVDFIWQGENPDPQSEETFGRCRLNYESRNEGHHRVLLDFYHELIRLRKATPSLSRLDKDATHVIAYEKHRLLFVQRSAGDERAALIFNLSEEVARVTLPLPVGEWTRVLNSADEKWQPTDGESPGGAPRTVEDLPERIVSEGEAVLTLSPRSFALYVLAREE